MTTGLTYSQYVTQIATMAVVAETDAAFVTILPQMITYAENRMYRDIDFMFTSTSLHGASFVLTAGSRNLSFNINLASNSDERGISLRHDSHRGDLGDVLRICEACGHD